MSYLFCDWKINSGNIKGQLVLLGFRLATLGTKNKFFFWILLPHLILYRLCVEWVLGIELPWKTQVGPGLIIYHGYALVINDGTVIGSNCIIRHSTTIGNKKLAAHQYSKSPVIGSNVDIGSNVCIIGPITIGDNVIIGAGSVIVKDVPKNSIVVGNPGKVIRTIDVE